MFLVRNDYVPKFAQPDTFAYMRNHFRGLPTTILIFVLITFLIYWWA